MLASKDNENAPDTRDAPRRRNGPAEIHQYRAALRAKLAELEAGASRLDGIAVETAPDAMDDSAFANDRDFAVERLVQITSLLVSERSALDQIAER